MVQPSLMPQLVDRLSAWTPSLRDDEVTHGHVFVFSVALAGAALSLLYAGWLLTGPPPMWVHPTFAFGLAMLALSVRVLHMSRSVAAAANMLLAVSFGMTLCGLLITGGFASPASPLLLVQAIAAAYFLDARWRAFWWSLVGLGYAVLFGAWALGNALPQLLSLPDGIWASILVQAWVLAQVSGMVVLTRPTETTPTAGPAAERVEPEFAFDPDAVPTELPELPTVIHERPAREPEPFATPAVTEEVALHTEEVALHTEEVELDEAESARDAVAREMAMAMGADFDEDDVGPTCVVHEDDEDRVVITSPVDPDLAARVAELEHRLAEARDEADTLRAQLATVDDQPVSALDHDLVEALDRAVRRPLGEALRSLSSQDDDLSALLRASQDAGARIHGLLEQVVDAARLSQGEAQVAAVGYRIRQLVDRVHAARRDHARAQDLSWEVHVQAGVPEIVVGDPDRVEQVVLTLVDEAFAQTAAGGIQLEVRIEDGLRFAVSDTGSGMNDATVRRLYDDRSARPALALAARTVTALGGRVGARSAEGIGTICWFVLPLVEGAVDQAELASLAAELTSVPRGLRVLLVEDNPVNRMVATRLLTDLGLRVTAAVDGADALAKLDTVPTDVIVMDCQMPRMSGIEATERIRALDGPLSEVPIVAVTADAQDDQRRACLAAGMDDHVTKPFRTDDLEAALLRAMKRRASGLASLVGQADARRPAGV
jgi:CheY-like chemotaxis protein